VKTLSAYGAMEDQRAYQQPPHYQQQPPQQHGYQQTGLEQDWGQPQLDETERQRLQLEVERRRQEEEMQRQQAEVEARRAQQEANERMRLQQEAERIRIAAEQQQRHEEMRRRAEMERQQQEEMRRHQEEMRREQERRRLEEVERRRREEEQRRVEQTAAVAIRKVIQQLRLCDEVTFPAVHGQLEEILEREGPACGSIRERVAEETKQAIHQTRERLHTEREQKAAQERRQREQEELVAALLKELTDLVNVAEAKVERLRLKATPLLEATNGDAVPESEEFKQACADVDEARVSAKAGCKACTDFLVSNRSRVEEASVTLEETRSLLVPLQRRVHEALREVVNRSRAADAAVDRARRRHQAERIIEGRAAVFKRYDRDQDGFWNRKEILAYAKGEFSFDVPVAAVDRLLELHGDAGSTGVARERYPKVKLAIGIAREEAASKMRKEERERKERELQQRKATLRDQLATSASAVEACEQSITGAETIMQQLPQAVQRALNAPTDAAALQESSPSAAELQKSAAQLDEVVAGARTKLQAARDELLSSTNQVPDDADNKELHEFMQTELKSLSGRTDSADARLTRLAQSLGSLRDRAAQKDLAELDRVRVELASALRNRMTTAGHTLEALFAAADTNNDGIVSEAELTDLLKSGPEPFNGTLDGSNLQRIFAELAEGSAGGLSISDFPGLVRAYYRVCKQTTLTEGVQIKESKTIRRIEEGEIFEVHAEPLEDEKSKVMRVCGRAVKDGVVGYISITGNQGTKFLEPASGLFKVLQCVDLTQSFALNSEPPLRQLKEGELLQTIKWESKEPVSGIMRMKVRAKNDSSIGWVTLADAEGTTLVKPN